MTLQFSYISDVYPNFLKHLEDNSSISECIEIEENPLELSPSSYEKFDNPEFIMLSKLKPGQKLKRKNGKLMLDTRFSFLRFFTRDSRWKVLEDLKSLVTDTLYKKQIVLQALYTLKTSVYHKDAKWNEAANNAIIELGTSNDKIQ
jgi:hypothetical protein